MMSAGIVQGRDGLPKIGANGETRKEPVDQTLDSTSEVLVRGGGRQLWQNGHDLGSFGELLRSSAFRRPGLASKRAGRDGADELADCKRS